MEEIAIDLTSLIIQRLLVSAQEEANERYIDPAERDVRLIVVRKLGRLADYLANIAQEEDI